MTTLIRTSQAPGRCRAPRTPCMRSMAERPLRSLQDQLQESCARHWIGTIGGDFLEPKPPVEALSLIHRWQRVQEDALVAGLASPVDDALHQRTTTTGSPKAVADEETLHLADAPSPLMRCHAPGHLALHTCHKQDTRWQ